MASTAQQSFSNTMPSAPIHTQSTMWQMALLKYCKEQNFQAPIYTFLSDRRGGRTAWSAIVTLGKVTAQARYFYDGHNNAMEDAAEVALQQVWNSR